MADTHGRTFQGQAGTSPTTLTISGGKAHTVQVKNKNDSAVDLLVQVPEVTGSEFDLLEPGDSQEYSADLLGIGSIVVQTASGNADYVAGVTRFLSQQIPNYSG